jgi:DNA-binding winged helix-turn-helix (wHTH) protein
MTNIVDVYVNYLRQKLGDTRERRLIHTVRGVGYQLGLDADHNSSTGDLESTHVQAC